MQNIKKGYFTKELGKTGVAMGWKSFILGIFIGMLLLGAIELYIGWQMYIWVTDTATSLGLSNSTMLLEDSLNAGLGDLNLGGAFDSDELRLACTVKGGQYIKNQNQIGCFSTTSKITEDPNKFCNEPKTNQARIDCEAVGGTFLCDSYNLGCKK